MPLDPGRLGAWRRLPFFQTTLPAIESALRAETGPVYPPPDRMFVALERTQPDATRVLILGQDPYHTPGKADGLAFSIPTGFGGRLDSLGNILRELNADLGTDRTRTDLSDWADQGVLLLNTALSVPQGRPHGHKSIGWRALVLDVLDCLDRSPRAVVMWGKPAQSLGKHLKSPAHLRIETAHPSPLSVHRGFFGSRPFSAINDWLVNRGETPINWAGTEAQ